MTRRKVLNIHNTDRVFNLNLTTKQEVNKFTKVTKINERDILSRMERLRQESGRFNKRDNREYLIYKEKYPNNYLNEQIINHANKVYYYTEDRVPLHIVNSLSKTPRSEVIYKCRDTFSLEDVNNVHLTSMATKVTIDVPLVLPDINPYDYLFSLYPLRYNVDKIQLSFPSLKKEEIKKRHKEYYAYYNGAYHLKSKYKYKCFQYIQEPLSTWKMNLWLICDSEKDLHKIEQLVIKNNNRFKHKRENSSEEDFK